MYSTKSINKWHGVPFLGGGSSNKREEDRSSYKGTQFLTRPSPYGSSISQNLWSQGPLLKRPDKVPNDVYDSGNRFLEKFPPEMRKKGFGTGDAPKRGEFMSGQRSEQYRDTLRTENRKLVSSTKAKGDIDSQIDALQAKIREIDARNPGYCTERKDKSDFAGTVSKVLYNIGNTEHGTTPVFLKDKRDTFYSQRRCLHFNKPRHVQPFATANGRYGIQNVGVAEQLYRLGPKRKEKYQFMDRGHLQVGQ